MSKQGLKSLFPMEDIAVMGLLELLPHLNRLRVSVSYIRPYLTKSMMKAVLI